MTFKDLSLHPKLLKALSESGYENPTHIQDKAIPKILRGFDIRGSAQTGTGKTAAFLLPALHRLIEGPAQKGKGPRVLILAPTRELAMQIAMQSKKYSKYLKGMKTVCVFGGASFGTQLQQISKPHDILIATPGRLIDFMERKKIQFDRVEMLILDEADRMLDMGFIEPVKKIVSKIPGARQTLLFSATLRGAVIKLSERLLSNPMEISVQPDQNQHANIQQKLYYTDGLAHKNKLLEHLLNDETLHSGIIFTSTKRHADLLVMQLNEQGHRVSALHGDMNQKQRTKTIQRLREGKLKVLVATDVAARGIDIQTMSHVFNFDLPRNIEDYVHRIGRTGRANNNGVASSFATSQEKQLVKKIEKFTGTSIPVETIAGLEPSKKASKEQPQKPFARKRKGRSFGDKPKSFGRQRKSFGEKRKSSGGKSESFGENRKSSEGKRESFGRKKKSFSFKSKGPGKKGLTEKRQGKPKNKLYNKKQNKRTRNK